jgi:predicted lipid-binding transport protein (Tim44 family)
MFDRMQGGVTTAIVGFLLLCVAFPTIVKNKAQYYGAFFAVLAIILLGGLGGVIASAAFNGFAGFITALLQVAALVMLLLSAGGMTAGELAGEMRDAVDTMRHGEPQKTVIVPITGQMPAPKRPVVYRDAPRGTGEEGPVVHKIDDPLAGPAGGDASDSTIPLE